MSKIKKVTVEKLAEMVQGGFNEVHDKMDRGFKDVYDKMDKNFGEVNSRLGRLEEKVNANTTSIQVLSGEIAELKVTIEDQDHEGKLRKHEVQLQHHDRRIRKLEETIRPIKH
ncbi:MAG: hypothetical protein HYW77_02040 [Parcubacteria group bacterium]|nr:hypothetical protein [Parcubacteria group bacterium]